jgi:hypothetical protein
MDRPIYFALAKSVMLQAPAHQMRIPQSGPQIGHLAPPGKIYFFNLPRALQDQENHSDNAC